MKNYVFKKQGIVVKAKSERQAREIYNQYLHDSSDLGVAEFLKSKGIKFSKIDGTKGNIVIKFDNEKDWTLGSKHLRTKYGKKGYESIKEGDKYQVILGDSFVGDSRKHIQSYVDFDKAISRAASRIKYASVDGKIDPMYKLPRRIVSFSPSRSNNVKWTKELLTKLHSDLERYVSNAAKDYLDNSTIKLYEMKEDSLRYEIILSDRFLKDSFTIDIKASDYADYAWKIENGDLAREVFHSMLRDGKTFEEAKKQHENICRVIESQIVKKVEKSKNIFNSMKKEYEEMYNKHHSKK